MASALVTAIFAWIALQLLAAVLRYGFKVNELVLGWFSISIQSAGFNRLFYALGRRHSNELRQWFGLGVLVAGMLGASAVVILIRELWRAIQWADQASIVGGANSNTWELGVAVPGLTVPWNHAIYIWLAAAASICVHEAGHALAAAAEGVGLHHIAAFTMFLLPGAYVALDNETMAVLNPWRTLRIVCGGVWHNAVLCMVCWLVAFLMPFLLLPAYSTGKGAVVRAVLEDSALANHLHPADVITRVNQCQVRNGAEWLGCMAQLPGVRDDSNLSEFDGSVTANQLLEIMGHPATKPGGGYCVPHELQAHSRFCSSGTDCSANELCFRESRPRGRKLSDETAGLQAADRNSGAQRHFAYGARRKSEDERDSSLTGEEASENDAGAGRELTAGTQGESQRICIRAREAVGSQPCSIPGRYAERAGGRCPSMSTCHLPILPPGEELLKVCYQKGFNTIASLDHEWGADWQHIHRRLSSHNMTSTRSLLQILDSSSRGAAAYRQNADFDKSCPDFLVFVGTRGSLLQAVEVTDYCPAAWWVPMRLPYMIEQLLAYTFAVSAALALLNMAPVYGLDGQAALKSLLLLGEPRDPFYGASRMRGSLRVGRELVRHCIINVCTSIFALLLALQVLRLTGYDVVLIRLLAAVRHLLKFSVRWG